ncbi:MAG: valine--tRNA ligase [Patescibacteria group bacterium]
MVPDKFLKPYSHTDTEKRIYSAWEESGLFNPDVCVEKGVAAPDAPSFSIVLPPPNVTGTLHTGHALGTTIEDIVVRYHRMKGDKTLWVPGTDHAAIATQSKVEKMLEKEGVKKRDLGREAFLERVNQFAQESHDTIVGQIRRMGSSIDWSREAFTLDEVRTKAVRTAFVRMYEDGLIYRGDRIVNWDSKLQTTVSDDEVDWKEEKTPFYYLKYGPFTIATARPETKFGDKYVVMHPDDARYAKYKHGDTLALEWINGPITATVIKDSVIDMEFGTGVMTITPWHDTVDFDIALRHKLDKEQIIDTFGKLLPIAGDFAGMQIKKAREAIVAKLTEKGLVEKIDENYIHRIAINSRGEGAIEPQILRQWFIDVNKPFILKHSNIPSIKSGSETTLKSIMRAGVEHKAINVLPDRFEKVYYHWIDNLRDWCISRQIWYGHRIPVWYRNQNQESGVMNQEEVYVGTEAPEGSDWVQDEDTLDTWFSSGLWTFSTLGWPYSAETATKGKPGPENDFANFHPTNLLETGYDILFFWVARMILMTGYLLGEVPFNTVYLHGLVRDEKGQKMSKSIGNSVDPLDVIDAHGADALRMALVVAVGPGNDSNLSDDKIKAYKKFANKIWNITRFVLEKTNEVPERPSLTDADITRINELNALIQEITEDLEKYRLYLASEKLYHYVWHTLADVIIEERKVILEGSDETAKVSAQWTLRTILRTSLALLHPFMPFITEDIWSDVKGSDDPMLMIMSWPRQI